MGLYLKDPDATLDYSVDWASRYLGTDSVAASSWTIEPLETGGLMLVNESLSDGVSTAVLADGVAGHVYRVVNRVMLVSGLVDERQMSVRVEHR